MRYCPRFSATKPSVSLLELTKNSLELSSLPFSDTPWQKRRLRRICPISLRRSPSGRTPVLYSNPMGRTSRFFVSNPLSETYFLHFLQQPEQPLPQRQPPPFLSRSAARTAKNSATAIAARIMKSSGFIRRLLSSGKQANQLIDERRANPRDAALHHHDAQRARGGIQLAADGRDGRNARRV